jgi:DNA-directed RNA polymerase specialized sigma subunit
MWRTYRSIIRKYPRISLQEERRLIRAAKKGSKQAADELVLRHIGFVIFRINKRAFPAYARRFGEDILSQAIVLMYVRVQTYNLRYYNEQGIFTPVRFVSYIWKFIDGLILASLRKELRHEKQRVAACWDGEEHDIFERIPSGSNPIIPALL